MFHKSLAETRQSGESHIRRKRTRKLGLTPFAGGDSVTSKLCAAEHNAMGGDLHGIATFSLTKQKGRSMLPTKVVRFLRILAAALTVCTV